MTIVLNENEWAEEMIKKKSLGSKPFETLSRVAKYYLDNNYTKKEVRSMLDMFLLQCEPTASLPKWSDTLDYAVTRAMKYNSIKIDSIKITQSEIERIDKLSGKQTKRLAFTLLCLSKYWDAVNPQCDHWVNNKDSEIMRLANINTSIKRQSLMYHTLNEEGLIKFSKKIDNTNVRVCFIDNNSPVVMYIDDFRNLGYKYLKFRGEPFFECQNCGITTKYNNPSNIGRQKYCKDCAVEVAIKQRINSVMRHRSKM